MLIKIINSSDYDQKVTIAALIQLKVFVREHWKADSRVLESIQIDQEARMSLMSMLLPTFLELEEFQKYVNLVLDVTEFIGEELCSKLYHRQVDLEFEEKIKESKYFRSCLFLFLGICKNYKVCTSKNYFNVFDRLLSRIWPLILAGIQAQIEQMELILKELQQFP